MQNYSSNESNSLSFGNYRHVPLTLLLKVMLGGVFHFIGWIFFGMGMIFMVVFMQFMDFTDYYLSDDSPKTNGQITEIAMANITVNDRQVYTCYYTFTDNKGDVYEGEGYSSYNLPQVGEEVQVQYLESDPNYSRIVDRRNISTAAMPSFFLLLFLIFPITGLIFLIIHFVTRLKKLNLLRNGTMTIGNYTHMERTGTKINNQTVFKLFFEFEAEDGNKYEAIARTHQTYKLRKEPQQVIFYSALNPNKALVKDELPGPPVLSDYGKLQAPSFLSVIPLLIVPGIVLSVLIGVYLILY